MTVVYSKLTPAQRKLVEWVRANGKFDQSMWGGKPMNRAPTNASITTIDCLVGGGWLIRRQISPFAYQYTLNPDAHE